MRTAGASTPIKTTKLYDNVYLLQGAGGNMAVQTGPQGKVLIDSSFSTAVPKIREALDALSKDPRVRVGVQTERTFYADQQKLMSTIINTVGWALAIMMGVAALFAALNTLYNAVATRVREIATLRAMGFNGWAVMISVLVEAMILGAVGGLIGGLLAFLTFNGMHSSTMNWASFSQMTFAFTVTPQLMITGIIYGLILTFVAGILPGIRAARLPITAGLREL